MISFLQVFICPYLIITSFLDRFISEISYISLPSIAISYLFGQRNLKKLSFFSVHDIDLYCFGQINCKKKPFFSVQIIFFYWFGQKKYNNLKNVLTLINSLLFSNFNCLIFLPFGQEIPRSKELGQFRCHRSPFS